MRKGQTLKTAAGIEVVLFPMQYMRITQGVNGPYSHQGDMALDIAGKDAGIDPLYMPVTAKVVYKHAQVGMVVYESTNKVLYADGTVDYIHFMTLHDNNINDLALGRIYTQGTETGDEGTAGRATGNHVHLVFGRGKSQGNRYPLVKNNYGVWVLPKQVDPRKVIHINGTTVLNDLGYKFKTYSASASYYKAFDNVSIVAGLNSIVVDSSFAHRAKIAVANGVVNKISDYKGTAAQNTELCYLAKKGKLKKA